MVDRIINISRQAGQEILKIYNSDAFLASVSYKKDDSPLTIADEASNKIISEALENYFPDIPVLSEEGKHTDYEQRKKWDTFWLVDPLDGTKEFINKNGEFTVNIALIKDNYPVLGVIYAPVLDIMYVGDVTNKEAYKIESGDKRSSLKVNNKESSRIAVRSRSHASEEEDRFLEEYDVVDDISKGSSLKFCMVAEGKADIYYRHGPTMEWDTGAGQAIAEAAGAKVYRMPEKERFSYNKENLLNGSFLVLGF